MSTYLLLLRRYLVVSVLMFWQGGFLFYAAMVVPTGTYVLGSDVKQGSITRRVAVKLNVAGVVALLPLAWDVFAGVDRSRWRRFARISTYLGMLSALLLLFWLHPRLDELLEGEFLIKGIRDVATFKTRHRWYLWISTVAWGCALFYLGLTLWSWRDADRGTNLEKCS